MLSFLLSTFLLAALLTPLILAGLYFYAISDIGSEPVPFPEPVRAFVCGAILAFTTSFVFASLMVMAYRLLSKALAKRR